MTMELTGIPMFPTILKQLLVGWGEWPLEDSVTVPVRGKHFQSSESVSNMWCPIHRPRDRGRRWEWHHSLLSLVTH